jgi:hypothetical protein
MWLSKPAPLGDFTRPVRSVFSWICHNRENLSSTAVHSRSGSGERIAEWRKGKRGGKYD